MVLGTSDGHIYSVLLLSALELPCDYCRECTLNASYHFATAWEVGYGRTLAQEYFWLVLVLGRVVQ